MKHVRFVSRLLNQPQLIAPAAGAAVLSALMPGARLDGWDGDADDAVRPAREYQMFGPIALVPVVGELVHRGSYMNAASGLCSYSALQDTLGDALADGNIGGILLDVDSPGGEESGCLDFAEWLAAQRGRKPIWASINQNACSAAYAIACAADRVVIGLSGTAGSIGVISYHCDVSAALKGDGVVVTYLYAGQHKVDGAPALPLSDQARVAFQARIDACYTRFAGVVAANRKIKAEAVTAMEAGIFMGQDAVGAGLADAIGTRDAALQAMLAKLGAGGTKPDEPEPTPAPPDPDDDDDDDGTPDPDPDEAPEPAMIAQACQAAGHPELIAGLLATGARLPVVNARIGEAKAIADAAGKVGLGAMAPKLIASGVSLETARELLFTAKAAAGDAPGIDSAHLNGTGAARPAAPKLDHRAIYNRMNGIKE